MESYLLSNQALMIRQRKELAELIGFETRNKYELVSDSGTQVGFCAEQSRSIFGFLIRQFLGHWRKFEFQIFDAGRVPFLRAVHPFRFFFQRLEVYRVDGRPLGAIQQRFAFFAKKFDVEDSQGRVIMQVNSGLFSFWTFPFRRGSVEVGKVTKRWSGALKEIFTDTDNFRVEWSPTLSLDERCLILAAGLFIDLQYFERKAD